MEINVSLAGIPVKLSLQHPEYLPAYEKYRSTDAPSGTVAITEQDIAAAASAYPEGTPAGYIERSELCPRLSDFLLKYDRVFFHGVAFMWRGKAWIFTAPPGTGKTTQYILWKTIYGEGVRLINGDKPILEAGEDIMIVHHSPWRGKENMGQELSGELGGIVVLEQSDVNRIERLGREAIVPVFLQFLYTVTPDNVKKVCEIEDKLLRRVPVFRLYNRGDEASARLCHEALEALL